MRLEQSAVVEGRILFADGTPAIGARVAPVTPSDGGPNLRMGGGDADGDGRYRLDGLVPGAQSIEARHDAAPRLARDVELKAGVNTIDLRFEGGFELSGRVIDRAGAPLAGADVRLGSSMRPSVGGPAARTEADGSFRVPGLVDGEYEVTAVRSGYAPGSGTVTVAGAPVRGFELRLGTGTSIVGTVRGLGPADLARVEVLAMMAGANGIASATPDAQGAFRIDNLQPGGWHLNAALAGTGRNTTAEVAVADGQPEARVDLDFARGFSLSGRVLLGDDPVAGAWVVAAGNGSSSGNTRTDADGRFRLDGLEKGGYRLLVNQWEQGLQHSESLTLDGDRDLVVRLPKMAVSGRVIDATDRSPLADAEVRIATSGGSEFPGARRAAVSDASGRFEIPNVPAGSWSLTAVKKGYGARETTVTLADGADTTGVELALEASEGLTLLVRRANGGVPDEVQVAVEDGDGRMLVSGFHPTAENGRVRLDSVPAGAWTLLVAADGSPTATLAVNAPGPAIPVSLPPACTLDVEVAALVETGASATVSLTGSNGVGYRVLRVFGITDGEWPLTGGRAHLTSLPPGTWTVTVVAGQQRWTGTVTTAPGTAAKAKL